MLIGLKDRVGNPESCPKYTFRILYCLTNENTIQIKYYREAINTRNKNIRNLLVSIQGARLFGKPRTEFVFDNFHFEQEDTHRHWSHTANTLITLSIISASVKTIDGNKYIKTYTVLIP